MQGTPNESSQFFIIDLLGASDISPIDLWCWHKQLTVDFSADCLSLMSVNMETPAHVTEEIKEPETHSNKKDGKRLILRILLH